MVSWEAQQHLLEAWLLTTRPGAPADLRGLGEQCTSRFNQSQVNWSLLNFKHRNSFFFTRMWISTLTLLTRAEEKEQQCGNIYNCPFQHQTRRALKASQTLWPHGGPRVSIETADLFSCVCVFPLQPCFTGSCWGMLPSYLSSKCSVARDESWWEVRRVGGGRGEMRWWNGEGGKRTE